MSKVEEYLPCRCGGILIKEFDCNSGLTSTQCLKCGEYNRQIPRVDENGNGIYEIVEEDGKQYRRLTFDVKSGGGFGVLDCCGAEVLESKEHGLQRLEELKNTTHKYNPKFCFLYLHDKETNTGEVVWGKGKPNNFDDEFLF